MNITAKQELMINHLIPKMSKVQLTFLISLCAEELSSRIQNNNER